MPARALPRPDTPPTSPQAIYAWLEYLSLDSSCRGLGGYELVETPELLELAALSAVDTDAERAHLLRDLIRQQFPPATEPPRVVEYYSGGIEVNVTAIGDANKARLHLLGLTPQSTGRQRPVRRRLAASAMREMLRTFISRYEKDLVWDVAYELWRVGLGAG